MTEFVADEGQFDAVAAGACFKPWKVLAPPYFTRNEIACAPVNAVEKTEARGTELGTVRESSNDLANLNPLKDPEIGRILVTSNPPVNSVMQVVYLVGSSLV